MRAYFLTNNQWVLLHFRTPLGLGLGLQLALSRVSDRNPTADLKVGYESAIALNQC